MGRAGTTTREDRGRWSMPAHPRPRRADDAQRWAWTATPKKARCSAMAGSLKPGKPSHRLVAWACCVAPDRAHPVYGVLSPPHLLTRHRCLAPVQRRLAASSRSVGTVHRGRCDAVRRAVRRATCCTQRSAASAVRIVPVSCRWRGRCAGDASPDEHLLVQAGTGTGKSLGYLVPRLLHDERVVVATATLALQHQLVERDIPALLDAAVATCSGAAVVRRAQGTQQLRLPAPDPRRRARRPGHPGRHARRHAWAPRSSGCASGPRRSPTAGGIGDRDSAPSHTDRIWRAGLGQPPRVPRREQVPVRRRVLRRARP